MLGGRSSQQVPVERRRCVDVAQPQGQRPAPAPSRGLSSAVGSPTATHRPSCPRAPRPARAEFGTAVSAQNHSTHMPPPEDWTMSHEARLLEMLREPPLRAPSASSNARGLSGTSSHTVSSSTAGQGRRVGPTTPWRSRRPGDARFRSARASTVYQESLLQPGVVVVLRVARPGAGRSWSRRPERPPCSARAGRARGRRGPSPRWKRPVGCP